MSIQQISPGGPTEERPSLPKLPLSSLNAQDRSDNRNKDDPEERKKDEEPPYPGCSRRFKVIGTFKFGNVVLRELEGIERCRGAPMIEGFPGLGLTSMIASGFISDQLKLPLVAVLTSETFPAMGLVYKYDAYHPVRIYGDERLVVVRSEFKVSPNNPDVVMNIGNALLDFAARHESQLIVTVDGLPLEALDKKTLDDLQRKVARKRGVRVSFGGASPGRPSSNSPGPADKKDEDAISERHITFVSNSEKWSKMLLDQKCKPMLEALIPSLSGYLVGESSFVPTDVVCLLAPVSKNFPDAWGAVSVVRLVAAMFPHIAIDIHPLEMKAQELEAKIASTMNEVISEQAEAGRSSAHQSMYG